MAATDDLTKSFGHAVRGLRAKAGLTQEDLADASGLSRNYVSDLELGKKQPTLSTIARLAEALGLRPHELVKHAEGRGRR